MHRCLPVFFANCTCNNAAPPRSKLLGPRHRVHALREPAGFSATPTEL